MTSSHSVVVVAVVVAAVDDCSDVTSSVYATPLVTSRPGKVRHGLLSVFSFASPPPPQGRSSTPTSGCHVTAAESASSGSIWGLECLEKEEEIERQRIRFIRGIKRGAYGEVKPLHKTFHVNLSK